MKILQVCPTYLSYLNGIETHVQNISEGLAKKNDVTVFTTDPTGLLPEEEVSNGVRVKRFKSWAPKEYFFFSNKLRRNLKLDSINYDVVHAHSYHDIPALFAAQVNNGKPFVFTPHYHGRGSSLVSDLLLKQYWLLGRKIFERAEKVICVSDYERRLIDKHFRIARGKVAVIPNGVNLREFKNLKKRTDHKVILYIGRLQKYKGVEYLIKVLPKLENDIVLDIVGTGPMKRRLVKLSNKLKINDRVRFYEHQSRAQLLDHYANSDLFVLLSKYEAFGICVAEALASKTPCVVANTSALGEWIDDKTCFGVDYPINLDKLANVVNVALGRVAEKTALLDWDAVVEKIFDLYASCYSNAAYL
jgi:glycosyltransferase involved in cell wall biosynthesis